MGNALRFCLLLLVLLFIWLILYYTTRRKLFEGFYYDTHTDWKPAVCDVEEGVNLRSTHNNTSDFAAAMNRVWNNTCAFQDTVKNNTYEVYTRDTPLDADKSLIFLDQQYFDCNDDGQVLNSFKYINSHQALSGKYVCTKNLQRMNKSALTRYTDFANASEGLTKHDASCGSYAISALGFESEADQLRLRYDCATDVITDPTAAKKFHTGWTAAVDNTDRIIPMAVDCPDDTVLTSVKFKNCPTTADNTAVYTCAPVSNVTASKFDKSDSKLPPRSKINPIPIKSLQQHLNDEFRDTRSDFVNMGRSLAGIIGNSGKGVARLMKSVGGIFTGFGLGTSDGFNAMKRRVGKPGHALVHEMTFPSLRKSFGDMAQIGVAFPRAANTTKRAFVSGWNNIKNQFDFDRQTKQLGDTGNQVGNNFMGSFTKISSAFPDGWNEFSSDMRGIPKKCFKDFQL